MITIYYNIYNGFYLFNCNSSVVHVVKTAIKHIVFFTPRNKRYNFQSSNAAVLTRSDEINFDIFSYFRPTIIFLCVCYFAQHIWAYILIIIIFFINILYKFECIVVYIC